jgi:two-component system LytT family sensor kinase
MPLMRFFLPLRPLLKGWLVSFLCWGAFSLALAWQLSRMAPIQASWIDILRVVGPSWLVWALATPIIFRFVNRLPIERARWRTAVQAHVAACLAFVLGFAWLTHAVGPPRFRQAPPPGDTPPVRPPPQARKWMIGWLFFGPHLPVYLALVSAAHALYFYRRGQEREHRSLELTASLAEARLQALRMQIQPHFLFNSLNALGALIRKDTDAADEMLGALSDFLRLTLASSGEQEVPLGREMEFAERYLAIEKIRFGDRLTCLIDTPAETLAALVPALLLQPLVENAVRYGIEPQRSGGQLHLMAWREADRLKLRVSDNGPGLSRPTCEGVGLGNTRARLRELYGAAASLEIREAPGFGITVALPFRIAT